jgi:hypothetical protein
MRCIFSEPLTSYYALLAQGFNNRESVQKLRVCSIAKCENPEIFHIENLTELTLVGGKYYGTQSILKLVDDLVEYAPDN